MKKNEKKMIGILILVAVLIIGVIYFVTRPTENATNGGGKTEQEYTKVESDGTVVNTSEKLNEKKEMQGFEITNIQFKEQNGETILSARVTNKTGATQETFIGNVVVLNKSGAEIGKIPVRISELQAGEAIDIEATITESYVNAYDFKLEK